MIGIRDRNTDCVIEYPFKAGGGGGGGRGGAVSAGTREYQSGNTAEDKSDRQDLHTLRRRILGFGNVCGELPPGGGGDQRRMTGKLRGWRAMDLTW